MSYKGLDTDVWNLQAYQREVEDCLVPAQVTISDVPAQEGSDINPESVKVIDHK